MLACDPRSAAAYVNLGVVEMRRKRWSRALTNFRRAETLAPRMEGIGLDIGLANYQSGDYKSAIPVLQSVLRSNESVQPRFLLGLCYFLTSDYKHALQTLEPNWDSQNGDLVYLYALGIAAEQTSNSQVADHAFERLMTVGGNSPEFHVLKGKAYLNRAQPDDAIPELERAAAANDSFPFVHFNLGWAYAKKHDFERARSEFLKDIAIEPDVPYNYEQLGGIASSSGNYDEAERYYKEALTRDRRLPNSLYGLGKVYERQNHATEALATWKKAEQLAPESVTIHYALAQLLQKMKRPSDAAREFTIVNELNQKKYADELANPQLPSPEIKQQP